MWIKNKDSEVLNFKKVPMATLLTMKLSQYLRSTMTNITIHRWISISHILGNQRIQKLAILNHHSFKANSIEWDKLWEETQDSATIEMNHAFLKVATKSWKTTCKSTKTSMIKTMTMAEVSQKTRKILDQGPDLVHLQIVWWVNPGQIWSQRGPQICPFKEKW